ncbi:hypothetical protein C8R44DRAFT_756487 [Mycena epipterygia]|nr:hypothetical protein C8R44DRAFT_756487 [Mycena epipterygia]
MDLRTHLAELDDHLDHPLHSDNDEGEQTIDIDDVPVAGAPILELPPEILSAIFIECLPTYSATPDPSRAPLLLGAICRDWREIALRTPWLWNSFIMSVDLGRTSAIIQLFECWLSRGVSCPLTMVISCYGHAAPALPYSLPVSLLRALNHCSSRWHDINLVLPFADFYQLQANQGLPVLKKLAIKASDGGFFLDASSPPPNPLNLFRNAPLLEDVCLRDGFILSRVTLPLNQLKYFDSQTATAVSNLDALRLAPHLEEVRLELHTLHNLDVWTRIHSNIKSLTLHSYVWENSFLDILQCMTFPALETLVISGYGFDLTVIEGPLLKFLHRSSPPLRVFILDLPQSPYALFEVPRCLIAMPTLVRLQIKSLQPQTANDLFGRMCDNTSLFLPQLQMLRVRVNGLNDPSEWTYETLVRMLVNRWQSQPSGNVVQLQIFGFNSSRDISRCTFPKPDSSALLQLEALALEGMDIDLADDERWI